MIHCAVVLGLLATAPLDYSTKPLEYWLEVRREIESVMDPLEVGDIIEFGEIPRAQVERVKLTVNRIAHIAVVSVAYDEDVGTLTVRKHSD